MTHPSSGPGAETVPGPDAESYAVLDIGADIGALVIHTLAGLCGTEIEISRAGAARTHSLVRERRLPGAAPIYAAVYPGLPAGEYTIWRDPVTPAATIAIKGGQVADYTWSGP